MGRKEDISEIWSKSAWISYQVRISVRKVDPKQSPNGKAKSDPKRFEQVTGANFGIIRACFLSVAAKSLNHWEQT